MMNNTEEEKKTSSNSANILQPQDAHAQEPPTFLQQQIQQPPVVIEIPDTQSQISCSNGGSHLPDDESGMGPGAGVGTSLFVELN